MKKTIAQITDTHLDDRTAIDYGADPRRNFDAVLRDITETGVTEIVFTGDIGHENTGFEETYAHLFKKLETSGLPYNAILGNHDHLSVARQYYHQPSGGSDGLYYSHEDIQFRYIYLDSSTSRISVEQFEWLQSQADTSKKTIVFIHHPVLDMQTAMDRIYPLHNRDSINALLQQCAMPVTIFCGHYHMKDVRTDGNITQYTTPAVSFGVRKESPSIEITADMYGYRIVRIDGDTISSELRIDYGKGFVTETGW